MPRVAQPSQHAPAGVDQQSVYGFLRLTLESQRARVLDALSAQRDLEILDA
jgi:hypothetical protein